MVFKLFASISVVEILCPLEAPHHFLITHISSMSWIKPTFTILWLIFWSQRNKISTVSSFSHTPQAQSPSFSTISPFLMTALVCIPFHSNYTSLTYTSQLSGSVELIPEWLPSFSFTGSTVFTNIRTSLPVQHCLSSSRKFSGLWEQKSKLLLLLKKITVAKYHHTCRFRSPVER